MPPPCRAPTVLFVCALFSVVAILLLPSLASAATNLVVTNCSNDTELRNDWNQLQSNPDAGGGTITFNCGTAAIVLTLGSLTNLGSVVVDGGGVITLSGGNSRRLFYVSAGSDLTLRNIRLTLGRAPGGSAADGGCIWSDGFLTLLNATVDGCYAANDGGGIFGSANSHTLIGDSTIRNNTAQRDCGGICEYGEELSVSRAIIDSNTSVTRYAGGIGAAHTVRIDHSTISNNTAASNGGGIFSNGSLTLFQTTIVGNASTGDGGGVINDGGNIFVLEVLFANNSANFGGALINVADSLSAAVASLEEVTLSQNKALNDGGGIFNWGGGGFDSTLTLTNSTIKGNTAFRGGGIAGAGTAITRFNNVTLGDNVASLNGGGIFAGSATNTNILTNVTLRGNAAPSGGGGIFTTGFTPSTGTFMLNTIIADSVTGGNCGGIAFSQGSNISTDASCAAWLTDVSDRNSVAMADVHLGALRDNGGLTLTYMIFPPSLAIDRGQCQIFGDQRGVARPSGISCDIGAVEYQYFTDDPSTAGITVIKAVHITELRTRIDRLRTRYGVGAFAWTVLGVGTVVQAQHVVDLRTALAQAYAAAGVTAPNYTDPTLAAGMTPRAAHVNELRAAVDALDIK